MDALQQVQELLALFEQHQLAEMHVTSGSFQLLAVSGRYPQRSQTAILSAPNPAAVVTSTLPPVESVAQAAGNQGGSFSTPEPTQIPVAEAPDAAHEISDPFRNPEFHAALDEAFSRDDAVRQEEMAKKAGWLAAKSPTVGTFYEAVKPGEEPLARKGDMKKKGDRIGIVEAMKMMNDVVAPCDCEVMQVPVKDGEIVEYGQPLLWLRPLD